MPSSSIPQFRLAVIGFGPRGLGALEALLIEAQRKNADVTIDIFDPFEWPAAGPNFDPDQSPHCILNIPIRALDIDPPGILSDRIKPFDQWSSTSYQPEDYPPRSDLGAYLNARFKALCEAGKGKFTITTTDTLITGAKQSATGWWVEAGDKRHGPYDEVLLTQGQPQTEPDPQLARWTDFATAQGVALTSAYPANRLIERAADWAGQTVAIRGLGLSTLDVLRMLTWGLGGRFENGSYIASGKEPHRILPFSLDGFPPAAKPATAEVDAQYDPTPEETRAFTTALKDTLDLEPRDALARLCQALVAPAMRILGSLDSSATRRDVEDWLEVECDTPGAQETPVALDALRSSIEMAQARVPPSIGYAIGQLWRKWQNELRRGVNAERHKTLTATALVGFDEGLKRYSYGPPVSAAQELLILIDMGMVSLCTVADPAVLLTSKGWHLIEGDDGMLASVMVDAVLPSPDLAQVSDPLVRGCVEAGMIHPIAEGLGAHTLPEGQLLDRDHAPQGGFSMLGRLALGSVIAADSLHDCFGASTNRWAAGVADRCFRSAPPGQ
ncbi:MAG: FAD/NAD(P)-binding protein [Sulfitobacter geojensis]